MFLLYTREVQPSQNLIKLVHYIIRVYAPACFETKSFSKVHRSPPILFSAISRIKLPFDDIEQLVKKNIQENDFCLLSEKFFACIGKNDDVESRNFE